MFDSNRSIDSLKPEMAQRVKAWLDQCKKANLNILITETLRSKPRHLWLWAKGRALSKAEEIKYLGYDDPNIDGKPKEKQVTWTLQSNHLIGEAIDFAFLNNGKLDYNGDWEKAFDLAQSVGLSSLFRLKGVDKPHLEFNHHFVKKDLSPLEQDYAKASEETNQSLIRLNEARKKLATAKGVPFIPHTLS